MTEANKPSIGLTPVTGRKGQTAGSMKSAVAFATSLLVMFIIMSVSGNVIGEIQETNCDLTYNSSTGRCVNASDATLGNFSESTAFNVTVLSLDGIDTFAGFSSVLAIIVVAAVILALIATSFSVRLV